MEQTYLYLRQGWSDISQISSIMIRDLVEVVLTFELTKIILELLKYQGRT